MPAFSVEFCDLRCARDGSSVLITVTYRGGHGGVGVSYATAKRDGRRRVQTTFCERDIELGHGIRPEDVFGFDHKRPLDELNETFTGDLVESDGWSDPGYVHQCSSNDNR